LGKTNESGSKTFALGGRARELFHRRSGRDGVRRNDGKPKKEKNGPARLYIKGIKLFPLGGGGNMGQPLIRGRKRKGPEKTEASYTLSLRKDIGLVIAGEGPDPKSKHTLKSDTT